MCYSILGWFLPHCRGWGRLCRWHSRWSSSAGSCSTPRRSFTAGFSPLPLMFLACTTSSRWWKLWNLSWMLKNWPHRHPGRGRLAFPTGSILIPKIYCPNLVTSLQKIISEVNHFHYNPLIIELFKKITSGSTSALRINKINDIMIG